MPGAGMPGAGMPVIGRLKKRPDFLKVAAARTKWVTPGLILQARQRPPQDRPLPEHNGERRDPAGRSIDTQGIRVGFTVSRKVGHAPDRNRARRRLRAAVGEVLPRHARPGYDYVLIGRRATLDRAYDKLVDDLRTALTRVATTKASSKREGGRHMSKGRPAIKGNT